MRGIFFGFLVAGFAAMLYASPRKDITSSTTHRNEGNLMAPFSVSCSSSTWTAVVTTREARRAVLIQSLSTNSYAVCLSTYAVGSTAVLCAAATTGLEISPGGALTDYGEYGINCSARDGSSGERLKGYESYDNRD